MFDRVTIRAADREASERFYGVVLRTLGDEQSRTDARDARWADFTVRQADERHPATRNLHVGFVADTRSRVDEFWRTGTHAGYTRRRRAGPAPRVHAGLLRRLPARPGRQQRGGRPPRRRCARGGIVDHLWIRVADLGVSRHFHQTIAPYAGLRLNSEAPDRVQFAGESGSYSVLAGTPTQHLHMAFSGGRDAAVDAFHREAAEAGYLSLESPAERIADDARAYAASIQDPDGHHIELVHHGR